MMKLSNKLVVFGVTSSLSMPLLAGDLNSPAVPDDADSAMFTIEDIWDRLNEGTAGTKRTTPFQEPTNAPGSTGKSLNDVMEKAPEVDDTDGAATTDVKSGKTFWGLKSGEWGLRTGTATIPSCTPNPSANPVFTDNGNGTVTDNRTCLMWLKDANCVGKQAWADVDTSVKVVDLINGASCDNYTDNTHTDWRLPTVQELQSLVHYTYLNPAMSNAAGTEKWNTGTSDDDAFSVVQSNGYWSSTTYADGTDTAWYVYLGNGYVSNVDWTGTYYIWPVRGGQ